MNPMNYWIIIQVHLMHSRSYVTMQKYEFNIIILIKRHCSRHNNILSIRRIFWLRDMSTQVRINWLLQCILVFWSVTKWIFVVQTIHNVYYILVGIYQSLWISFFFFYVIIYLWFFLFLCRRHPNHIVNPWFMDHMSWHIEGLCT